MRWSFKGVCCRISSRPISSLYGANLFLKGFIMKRKHDKNSWLVLYIKISFKGFKVVFSIEK
ncbi:hypothetical protein HPNQ4099_1666 [Helicobacter pylori NQ4099]|uniref:Uncharacterized protein n=1 Tax=Helicobacter pylori NQ4099 TaxID=992026 RepID=J0IRQ7_HELPX|nr:hypothetical protein [Helicobacter pylori]EJB27827.1 hypothetical protein HPNQ4099_1666 [Helicobacter pylori NQ4099]MDO7817429.1 hypothetical protein [Helicobacter pylori]MDO7824584.1 hypothetical protein [Helicobacter pylori]OOC33286.1 hypothetical protein BZK24_05795 [Helicobacter pylori]